MRAATRSCARARRPTPSASRCATPPRRRRARRAPGSRERPDHRADGGAIRFGGEDVTALPPQQRGTAMVFQSYALWPHMTVFDNVAYGLRLMRVPRPAIDTRVRAALALVEIGDVDSVARRKPGALS